MMYWALFVAFLKVGTFSFGGAYGAIPIIRDIVLTHGWLTDETFAYFVAVSESTPGPIMVNLATYIGSEQAGLWGALVATVGVVLPSFVIVLVIVALMRSLMKNRCVQAVLQAIKPCFIGIVLSMGIYMVVGNLFLASGAGSADGRVALITAALLALSYAHQKIWHKDMAPIALILLSAGMGIVAYGVR